MINHRQIAIAIQRGRRFLKALKAATDSSAVTREQLRAVAKEHKLDETIPEGYIVAGILSVYGIPQGTTQAEEIILLEPNEAYLVFWKKEPDDEMAYAAVIMSQLYEKHNAFVRFMHNCNLPANTNCLYCGNSFVSRIGKKYCSDKCRWLDHAHHKTFKQEIPPSVSIKAQAVKILTNIRDFISSL